MSSPRTDPTAWFDQFPLDGIGGNEQWCARHWAPCPVFGANGMGATMEVLKAFVDSVPGPKTPDEMNAAMQRTGQLCCALGDELMYEIWGHWPPVAPEGGAGDAS